MLKINNLTVTTLKGRTLIRDFSFVLNDGDKVALIGEEGNGKSTLLKIMAGIDVSNYVTCSGTISGNEHAGYLPQKPTEGLEELSPVEYICGDREHDYQRIYELLKFTQTDDALLERENIKMMSGGEKVRMGIIRLLYKDPDILLMDEPTNDLDLQTVIWLEEFINNIDKTIVFTSHDETLLENCALSILHLEQLKRKQEPLLTYSGEGYREYHKRRGHNIEKTNQLARAEKKQLDKQLERFRQIYQKVEYQQRTISRQDPHGGQLLKKKMRSLKAQQRLLDTKKENMTVKFEPEEAINVFFDEISVNPNRIIIDLKLDELRAGNKLLAKNVELFVKGREKVCLIGANGAGKTTLLHIIREQLRNKEDLETGYLPQDYHEVMDYSINCVEWLLTIINDRSRIQSLLGSMRFTSEEMTHPIEELSEGQKCKVLLASMILKKCQVLLLDEPTRNLSPLSNPEIRKILREYGGCIIAVSHDRLFIDEVCERVLLLDENGLKELN